MSNKTSATSRRDRRARLVLIAPVWPYRSGVAQHSTMLGRALAARCDLTVFSFKRLYPRWLFPGISDRDSSIPPPEDLAVEYLIDTLRPVTWLRTVRRIRDIAPGLVLMPWWTVFLAPVLWAIARGCRRSGIPVRFVCHNVLDHEPAAWKAVIAKAVLRHGRSYVVQSADEQSRLWRFFPEADIRVHPHPVYRHYPAPASVPVKRAALELLFFGIVRPYKGLDVLIEAMGRLPPDKDVYLTVAGEFWSGRDAIERRIDELALRDKVEIVPRYVSDAETAHYFSRADVVVLPYRTATGSGVLGLAYHYGKPVVVTRVGGLADVVDEGETGFIVAPGDPDDLALAIGRLTRERAEASKPAIYKTLQSMTWDSLAATVLADSSPSNVVPTRRVGESEPLA